MKKRPQIRNGAVLAAQTVRDSFLITVIQDVVPRKLKMDCIA